MADIQMPNLGAPGEECPSCGSVLATDQRYCVNCGWRRGAPRVDYEKAMTQPTQQLATAGGPRAATQPAQWNPIVAVGAIGILGIMLLLGVLIGKDDNGNTQTVAAAPAATTATTATAPTDTTAAAPDASAAKADAGGAGAGNVEKGGSGSTEGIQTADTAALENAAKGGQGAQAGKNLPDQVATGGNQEEIDPEGIKNAGGGSGSTCIGC